MTHSNDSFEREIVAPHDFFQAWFRGGAEPTRRLSTVVFSESASAPNGLEWLHVHEVWLEVE